MKQRTRKEILLEFTVVLLVIATIFLVNYGHNKHQELQQQIDNGPQKVCWNETHTEELIVEQKIKYNITSFSLCWFGDEDCLSEETTEEAEFCNKDNYNSGEDWVCDPALTTDATEYTFITIVENCNDKPLKCFKEVTEEKCEVRI